MAAELAGDRRVEHVAGVGRAHLEQDAHLELAQDLVGEVSVEVVHGVAPRDQVDAQAGAFSEDHVEVVGGSGVVFASREAEFVLASTEVAESGQVVDEEEHLGAVGVGLLTPMDLRGHLGEDSSGVAPAADLDPVRQDAGQPGEHFRVRMVFGRPVEDEETRSRPYGCRPGRRELRREAQQQRGRDPQRGLVVLSDDQEVVAAEPAEQGRGRVLDRDGVAEPGLGGAQTRRAIPGRPPSREAGR